MKRLANSLIIFIAIEHLVFLVLEMFLWTSPTGMRVFGLTPEFARQSATLAANQGLYNGFLAAGLIWSFFQKDSSTPSKMFFLGCVFVAGLFGGLTAKTSILFVQGMPALAALVLVILSQRKDA